MDHFKGGFPSFPEHGALSPPVGPFNVDGKIFKLLKEEDHSIWKIFNGIDKFLVGSRSSICKRQCYSCGCIFGQRCWRCLQGRDHSQATLTSTVLEAE